jgi:RHS repeat-associated protein
VQDANWNTTAIIAATGVPGVPTLGMIISRFIYSPYGDVQVLTRLWETPAAGSTPAVPWSHLFQGLKVTDVTGLAYVRHRDYSASLGRFIERDPIGFDAGDNNWYRFVANGPTGRTDPSGLADVILIGHAPTCLVSNAHDSTPRPFGSDPEWIMRSEGFTILGGSRAQQAFVMDALETAERHIDDAIDLLENRWRDFVKQQQPYGGPISSILSDPSLRTAWLNKFRRAKHLLQQSRPVEVVVTSVDRGRNGPGDSPAEVNCWEIPYRGAPISYRWWSTQITVKPVLFWSPRASYDMAHEYARLIGIADGERGPLDAVTTWDEIINAATR